jgi:hypothetical protein
MNPMTSPYEACNWFKCRVEEALANANSEPLVQSYVGLGEIAWDNCCGTLVVAPERVFRSVEFPNENVGEEQCYAGELTLNLLVLLVRCVPVLDDRGRAPSPQMLDEAHRKFMRDSAIIWRSVTTCDLPDDWERSAVAQTFVGAEGGCIAAETRFILGIPQATWRLQ